METPDQTKRGPWQRLMQWLDAGFHAMARYPYDISECHWHILFPEPPDDDVSPSGEPSPPPPPKPRSRPGRGIKLVPPPSVQRHRGARATHVPGRRRRGQPVGQRAR